MGCSDSKLKFETSPTKEVEASSNNDQLKNLKLKGIFNSDPLSLHYTVIEKIGNGSFGKVYKVKHKLTGQKRALKVINKSIINYQDDDKKFLKEIELLSKLDHPSIIKVYEYFIENNNFYVVQELCNGGELYEQIYKIDSFTEKSAAQIMKQLLSSVVYLHLNCIVHRDLKPENIMLESSTNDDFLIKLIDFGTANYFEVGKFLTQKMGTAYYIAPEVLVKKYNEKCDVWSCGVILYILLCGYPPFEGDTDEEIMERIETEEVKYDSDGWSEISEDGKNFLKKLLTKNFNKRISAQDALKDPWLTRLCSDNSNSSYVKLTNSVQKFQQFDSRPKLKNAIMAFMVHHLATEEMTKDLIETFKKMDKSGDGRLSLEELLEGFKEILKAQGRDDLFDEPQIRSKFNAIDKDGSKYIEIQEFITVTINEELLLTEKNLKMTFDYFDKDKNGCLDQVEVLDLLNNRGSTEDNTNQVKELIQRYDTNHDGVLSFEEFKQLISELKPHSS